VLVLSFSLTGKAMANCAPSPKYNLWKELSHEFIQHYVDDKYDGDWDAYLSKLEGYETQLRDIHDKGRGAVITWRSKKIRLKGAKLAKFLELVEQRLTITRCLADNESLAEFTTAAGGTGAGDEVGSSKSRQCDPIPNVAWWTFRTHEGVASYVARKYRGD